METRRERVPFLNTSEERREVGLRERRHIQSEIDTFRRTATRKKEYWRRDEGEGERIESRSAESSRDDIKSIT
tara:strand:- start:1091 stop:1309 length:219 start_codon:yes stop_codon:yes gene_type:complete